MNQSPFLQHMFLCWAETRLHNWTSWENCNHGMQYAYRHAIRRCYRICEGDLDKLTEECGSRWKSEYCDESAYTLAICARNNAAVKEFERYFARAPYIANNVCRAHSWGDYPRFNQQRARVALELAFDWDGRRVECTGFRDGFMTALEITFNQTLPKKRYKITHEDLKAKTPRPSEA